MLKDVKELRTKYAQTSTKYRVKLQGKYPQITSSSHSSMVNDKNLQGQYPQITSSSHPRLVL